MSSVYDGNLTVSIFGQSHAPAIGVTIDGLPAGLPVDLDALGRFLRRRAPGQNAWSTPRKEADLPEFLCGLKDGRTCGAPLTAIIRNTNTRSGDYENLMDIPRPGHADYTAQVKFGGAQDAAMVGYRLKNTVSPFGTVTRGVCATQDGLLRKVQETYKIRLCPDGLIRDMSGEGEGIVLDPEALVSMNLWGYHPQMLDVMAQYFDDFVHTLTPGDEKRECLLPVMMDALTAQSRVRTRVLQTDEHWFGLTYQDDKPGVVAALRALHADGTYPPALWK